MATYGTVSLGRNNSPKDQKRSSNSSSKINQRKYQFRAYPKPKKIERIAAYCPCKVSTNDVHVMSLQYGVVTLSMFKSMG